MSYDSWKTDPGPQYDPSPLEWQITKEPYYGTNQMCHDCDELADYLVELKVYAGFTVAEYYCNRCAVDLEKEFLDGKGDDDNV